MELSGEMIWTGCIAMEMVDGWTAESIEILQNALNNVVDQIFTEVETAEAKRNPLVRLVLED